MAKGRSRAAAPTSFKEEKKKPVKAKAATLVKCQPYKIRPTRAAAPSSFKEEKKPAPAAAKKKPAPVVARKRFTPPRKAAQPPPATKFMTCPETGERVFVGTVTLADMKKPPKGEKRKILFKVPSAKIRQTLYDELALCLDDRETRLLPKYGGRPWSIICRVTDNANAGSPFFRWFRGKLELAVLPHLLEKIPDPPKFPGYEQTAEGVRRLRDAQDSDAEEEPEEEYDNLTEEEVQRMESLVGREVSALSQVAWDHRKDTKSGAPLPTITLKWTCPLRQIFQSRKAAWDHAVELAKAEQFVDRFIYGRGKNGCALKPFRPNRKQTLQAGKVRFLRDGLWIVGQEQNWQNDRYKKMYAKQNRQPALKVDGETDVKAVASLSTTASTEPPKKRKRMTGMQLFVTVHRVAHQEARFKELKAEAKRKPRKRNYDNKPVAEEEDMDQKPKSKTLEKVGMPTPPPVKSNNNSAKPAGVVKFGLADADRELRTLWKQELSAEQRKSWETKAQASFHQKLYNDDRLRSAHAEKDGEYTGSGDETDDEVADEDSDKKPAAKARLSKVKSNNGAASDTSDEDDVEEVQFATDNERAIWEIMSEAELECWKGRASETLANIQRDKNTIPPHPLEPYLAYQRKIHYAYFNGESPEDYEERNLKRLKGPARRQYISDNRKQKELLAQGLKIFPADSYALLKEEIEGWVTKGLASAKRKATKRQRKAAKSTATRASTSGHLRVKQGNDDDPELKTLCSPAASRVPSSANTSTPISPSPPLGEPAGVSPNRGSQVQEVATHADDNGKLGNSVNEESAEIRFRRNYEAEEAAAKALREQETKKVAAAAKKQEEEEEAEAIYFEPTTHYCLTEKQIKLCHDACMEHFEDVMRTVKAKDLTRELADGFDVLRERGRGRYDMELPVFETKKFDFLNDISKAPWMPIVKQVLGDDVVLIHKGCFLSLPDAANQKYHQDGPHLHPNSQKPCHSVNVFTPLVDMTMQHGPTEFCLGSHILGQEDWEKRYIETPLPRKGVPVMFDYRLGHRGLANTSKEPRPIVYCTYARARDGKEFRDSVNFSRKRYRKLGEMVEKPMSREERTHKRRVAQEDAYDSWWATRYVPELDET